EQRSALEASSPKILELGHRTATGGHVFLSPDQESHGTRRLLAYADSVLNVLAFGGVLLVDELDAGMHARMSAALLGPVTDPASNRHGPELVFTSHDESVLSHLRRDEIVLNDNGVDGASTAIRASDYDLRQRDDVRRAYAEG